MSVFGVLLFLQVLGERIQGNKLQTTKNLPPPNLLLSLSDGPRRWARLEWVFGSKKEEDEAEILAKNGEGMAGQEEEERKGLVKFWVKWLNEKEEVT